MGWPGILLAEDTREDAPAPVVRAGRGVESVLSPSFLLVTRRRLPTQLLCFGASAPWACRTR